MAGSRGPRRWVRWVLRHGAMRRTVARQAHKGDLGATLIIDRDTVRDPYPHYEQIRDQGRIVRSALTLTTVDHEVTQSVLRSPDFCVGMRMPENAPSLLRALLSGRRELAARARRAAVAALERPAGPHPHAQAGHPLVQREGDRRAARAHRGDRDRAAGRDDGRRAQRPAGGRDRRLRGAAPGHRDRRDAGRADLDARAVPAVGRGRRVLAGHGPDLRPVPALGEGHRRAVGLDARPLRDVAAQPR